MKRIAQIIPVLAILLNFSYAQNSARMCTVKRGGATLISEIDNRSMKVRAGRKLGFIENHADLYVLISYSGSTWRVASRRVVCK